MTSRPPQGPPLCWTPTTSPPTPISPAGTSLQLPAQLLGRPARRRGPHERDRPHVLPHVTPQRLQKANCRLRRTLPNHQAPPHRQQAGLAHSQQTLPHRQQATLHLQAHTLQRVPLKQPQGLQTQSLTLPHRLHVRPLRQHTPGAAWQPPPAPGR